jgi:hypothetical protein
MPSRWRRRGSQLRQRAFLVLQAKHSMPSPVKSTSTFSPPRDSSRKVLESLSPSSEKPKRFNP